MTRNVVRACQSSSASRTASGKARRRPRGFFCAFPFGGESIKCCSKFWRFLNFVEWQYDPAGKKLVASALFIAEITCKSKIDCDRNRDRHWVLSGLEDGDHDVGSSRIYWLLVRDYNIHYRLPAVYLDAWWRSLHTDIRLILFNRKECDFFRERVHVGYHRILAWFDRRTQPAYV